VNNERKQPVPYRERVLPSVGSLWSLLLLTPAIWLVFLPFTDKFGDYFGIGLGVFFSFVILVTIWFGSPVIEVDESGFSVGDSQLPLSAIGGFEVIEASRAFEERGHRLDAAAYVRFQLSVNTLIKLQVVDAQDPTPYWLIATRNPQQIADTIVAFASRD
jgi:hypothetical protein